MVSMGSHLLATNFIPNFNGNDARCFAAVTAPFVMHRFFSRVEKSGNMHRFTETIGTNPTEFKKVATLSAASIGASYIVGNQKASNTAWKFGSRLPFAAGAYVLATSKTTDDMLKSVPFVGNKLQQCSTYHSSGVCRDCRLRKGLVGLGIYAGMCSGLAWLNYRTGWNI